MEDTYVRFEPNPLKIQAWRERLLCPRAPQEDSTSPAELYARAVPTLLRWKDRLVESTLWREVSDHRAGLPPGILCVLEGVAPGSPAVEPSSSYPSTSVSSNLSINSVWTGSVGSSSSSSGAAASFLESVRSGGSGGATPVLDDSATYRRGSPVSIVPPPGPPPGPPPSVGGAVLALPAELSAFIEYRTQLEDIFQDPLLFYPYLDRKQELVLEAFDDATPTHDHDLSAAASTLTDIFYLLQLLIPGMLLVVHDTLTFVNKFNVAVPSERNTFNGQSQSHHGHGRSTTLFEISLGNDTPSPSPKEFSTPTGTASRSGGGAGAGTSGGSSGGSGNLSRVILTRTRRGVPPAQWILNNALLLEEIFGRACLRAFHDCAGDPSRANWTTVYAAHGKRLELG